MQLLLSLLLLTTTSVLTAQTITIRMINARSGKPIGNKNVAVLWGDAQGKMVTAIDASGLGRIVVPPGKASFFLMGGPKAGKEPGRIAYSECSHQSAREMFVEEVLRSGFAPANDCDAKVHVNAKPGEVVYYIEPLHWWQPDFQ